MAIDSCTILTTTPNDLLRPLHHRMAVILAPEDYDLWLAPAIQEGEQLQPLLRAYPSEELTAYAVSPREQPGERLPRVHRPPGLTPSSRSLGERAGPEGSDQDGRFAGRNQGASGEDADSEVRNALQSPG